MQIVKVSKIDGFDRRKGSFPEANSMEIVYVTEIQRIYRGIITAVFIKLKIANQAWNGCYFSRGTDRETPAS